MVSWKRAPAAAAILAASLLLGACGDDAPATNAADTRPTPAAAATPEAAPPDMTGPVRGQPVLEALALNEWYRAILVDESLVGDPRNLEAIARPYCDGLTVCRTAIWYDEADLPRAMPVGANALLRQAFALGRTASGTENILWNCDLYPQFEAEHACLPRLMQ